MEENNLSSLPYAEWLEKALREMITFPVKGICISVIDSDGTVMNNYHNVGVLDKLAIAGVINQDAMLNTLTANDYIKAKDEEEDE